MKKRFLVGVAVLIIAVIGGIVVFWAFTVDNALKHDTNQWAVIQDINGDRIAVEPTSNQTWLQLTGLYANKSVRWVGGIVEAYTNKWGFRFKPETITIAEVTAEAFQSTLKLISQNLDSWLGGLAYVSATVVEIHGD